MQVHDLSRPARLHRRKRKRVGRGIGGKGGKTAGRGTKGQGARDTVARGFEGGQMPLKQRVPKLKGFNNPFRVEYQALNLDVLEASGLDVIDPEMLHAHGLSHKGALVKVLARGEITRPIQVTAHAVSRSAEAAITAAGGSVDDLAAALRCRPPAGQGQPVHQPLARALPARPS